ncbi:O-acetyl-ADP-ribose deacetylase [Arthrobacter sp. Soil736]|uniref:O-acetyl-ADP-ribose deacetylase n=1 Tax=Arthrobacter sp. Soil736 TaxID=1736395 RepID=UPI0009E7AF59|nr:O-acetyl-ADP-ribose deacetylase [Arthrobacter sp. Soil736]
MRIEIVQGDITGRHVDAIVNAANSSLMGGGGVDGAIHRAAGPELLEACRRLRSGELQDGLAVGAAVATPGFRLPATWVIHTVGPNRHVGQTDPALLASCFTESLRIAEGLGARSLAFPAVGAGVYGWDARQVAQVALDAVRGYAGRPREPGVDLVEFVLFSAEMAGIFRDVLGSDAGGPSAADPSAADPGEAGGAGRS